VFTVAMPDGGPPELEVLLQAATISAAAKRPAHVALASQKPDKDFMNCFISIDFLQVQSLVHRRRTRAVSEEQAIPYRRTHSENSKLRSRKAIFS
jgi:hypothetical protein